METAEGSVRVSSVPYVTIGDTPLKDCSPMRVQREILALVNRIQSLREENANLRAALKREQAALDEATDALVSYVATDRKTDEATVEEYLNANDQ